MCRRNSKITNHNQNSCKSALPPNLNFSISSDTFILFKVHLWDEMIYSQIHLQTLTKACRSKWGGKYKTDGINKPNQTNSQEQVGDH